MIDVKKIKAKGIKMNEEDLLSLLQYINYKVNNGDYCRTTMESVVKFLKKEIKKCFLEGLDD